MADSKVHQDIQSYQARTLKLKRLIASIERRVEQLESHRASKSGFPNSADRRSLTTPATSASGKAGVSHTAARLAKLGVRFSSLESRVQRLEAATGASDEDAAMTQASSSATGGSGTGDTERRLLEELKARGVEAPRFVRVPGDYYDRPLDYRRHCLAADSIQQLCKSIVMENTKAPASFQECGGFENSRYYCVIVQYAARLHADKLKRFLHKLNGSLGIKNFNMRLAPADVSDRLTGYTHNAVTPICLKTRLPILMSHRIQELDPPFFWLGAGEVDLKVGMPVARFLEAYKPLVIDCSYDEPTENTSCLSK